jgi:hypothetical protein
LIEKLLRKTLKNKEKMLRTLLTDKPLVYFISEKFADKFMEQRSKKNIFLKSLRLSSKKVDLKKHQDYKKYNKEVKVFSEKINIDKTLLIWDDYVAIVDVKKKTYELIKNQENANVMKKWFDLIWDKGK